MIGWFRYRWTELATLAVLAAIAVQTHPAWWVGFVTVLGWCGRQEWRTRARAVTSVPEIDDVGIASPVTGRRRA